MSKACNNSCNNILYTFRRCPYAMRARLALKVARIDYEHREVLLRDKPAAMLDISPKGSVPVFLRADGKVIDESFDVMLWALKTHDPDGWLAPDMNAMQDVIKPMEGPFAQHQFRYKYASFFNESLSRADVNTEEREKAGKYLKALEIRLCKTTYLMGEHPSLADMAIVSFVRQFAMVEPDWWNQHPYPALASWLSGIVDAPLFASIMGKYQQWKSGDPITIIAER